MTLPSSGAVVAAGKAITASAVRTWTPMLVALIVQVLGLVHVEVEDETLLTNAASVLISSAIGLLFYVGVRALEVFKSSKFGKYLLGLGLNAAPAYFAPAALANAVQPDAVVEPEAGRHAADEL